MGRHSARVLFAALAGVLATASPEAARTRGNEQHAVLYAGKNGEYRVDINESEKAGWLVKASYSDASLNPSFFGLLQIETSQEHNDSAQAHAAGYLEGFLTHGRVFQHYQNMKCQVNCSGDPGTDNPLYNWLLEQDKWVESEIEAYPEDATLMYVGLLRQQLAGLEAGYAAAAPEGKQLPHWAFLLINGVGDLFDIKPAVSPSTRPDGAKMSLDDIEMYMVMNGHCSGLVKVTGDLSELFVGHSSWFTYSSMLRIFKRYNFRFQHKAIQNRRVSFSSYPGMLSSLDDFYQMHDTRMVMVQTTNNVFDPKAYDLVTNHALLAWHRVISANALSKGGEEWGGIIKKYNSGTYNNQYMVVDLKLFTPSNALPKNLLWVTEQMPGLVVTGDTTVELRRGYWPSYNVPYWPEIYQKSGYDNVDKQKGHTNGSEYELAPRAKIFRRDEANVVDIDSFKAILRYNDYEHDPYSGGSPFGAICSRGDLSNSDSPSAGGCYDTKVTSFSLFNEGKAQIINGPTTSGGILPAFSWAAFNSTPHVGMPTVYNFTFQEVTSPWLDRPVAL